MINSLDRETQTISKTRQGVTNISSAVVYFLFYWVISTFTSSEYYYGSKACVYLLSDSRSLATIYYYLGVISVIFLIVQGFSDATFFSLLKGFIFSVAWIVLFVYCVMLTIDLFRGEPCGNLYLLILAWVILNWIGFIFMFCYIGFLAFFGAGLASLFAYFNRI